MSSFITATTISTLDSTDVTCKQPLLCSIPVSEEGTHTTADEAANLIVYGTVETAVTMIAACIPVLRVLVRDVQQTYLKSRSGGRGTQASRRRRSDSFSGAGDSTSVTQVRRLSEDGQFSRPVMKSVVVQEKS